MNSFWGKIIGILVSICLVAAASAAAEPPAGKESWGTSHPELLARGKYLVTVGGCHDCHTPKIMTDKGPALDTKNLLAGFPSSQKLPAVPDGAIGPTKWGGFFTNDLTGWAGPWGVSFASNLTPDKETGIGAWRKETFIQTIRSGKTPDGRPILPPRPWENLSKEGDRDLEAIFAYLMSIRPVRNMVPAPMPPK
jgi:hypothetical protein